MLSARVVREAQEYMLQQSRSGLQSDLSGWLIHDYRRSNPIFTQVMGEKIGTITRPCFLFIPVGGDPSLLVHHVDAGKFAASSQETGISSIVYRNRQTMLEGMESLLPSDSQVAMEYSPLAGMPRVSKVDAGTVELVGSLGVKVVSSADLLQYATQRWSEVQLSSHMRAADKLGRIVLEAFDHIGQGLSQGVNEFQVAEFIRGKFDEEGLHSPDGPIVAINGHASDPHYEPSPEGAALVQAGDWVLIDLWAKERAEDSVYADITWVAYVGEQVPEKHREVFETVITARDAALKYLEGSARQGITLQGHQVDRLAREYIARRGYGEYFTHRLGHSISGEVHGDAVNLDSFETEDTRSIIPGICFSIEPGIYLPEFGVRSEIDVYMSEEGPYATTPVQQEVVLIKAS